MIMNETLHKKVDGEKIKRYFNDHPELTKAGVCKEATVNRNVITDAQRTNKTRTVFWNSICDTLNVPRNYFDWKEPVVTQEETKEPDIECAIDLADIQLSLNKIEALLLKQNELLNTIINKNIVIKSPATQWDRIINKEDRNGRANIYQP